MRIQIGIRGIGNISSDLRANQCSGDFGEADFEFEVKFFKYKMEDRIFNNNISDFNG